MKPLQWRVIDARERRDDTVLATLTLVDAVGCAMRRDRLRMRESQRAYADRRGLSTSHLARLERRAGSLSLGSVLHALSATAFGLAFVPTGSNPTLAEECVDDLALRVTSTLVSAIQESGLSRRAFATRVGVSPMCVSRLVHEPARVKLETVLLVLAGCDLTLVVTRREGGVVIHAEDWDINELTAEVRGGQRRFAGHRLPVFTPDGPHWWLRSVESLDSGAEVPQWTTVDPDSYDIPRYHPTAPLWIDSA